MPRNDDGQFEMVLGNRQVLSILFVVVILLGVFFTMGYMLGRNSVAPAAPVSTSAKKPATAPARTAQQQAGKSVPAFQREAQEAPPPVSETEASQLAAGVVAPSTEAAGTPSIPTEPAPGQTFLQVVAVKRPEAELVADVLKKKGFRSLIAPHPTEDLFRVLVGPLEDADELARTRAGLQAAGFKPIVRKY